MVLFLKKTTSRVVHHYHEEQENKDKHETSTSLTVWTKSLVFSCTGFTVIGSDGGLAFRVDNYTGRPDEITLMDGSGNPIFTICRRTKLRLLDNFWFVYEGEGKHIRSSNSTKPVFCVRKNIKFRQTKEKNVLAYVYCGVSDKRHTYTVEGSYTHRSCKILDESGRIVGETKKKEKTVGGVSLGSDVYHLNVKPGFESGLAMVIVVLLHQMFSS
ncbi:hypothetical protein ACS0TY_004217 [Phlomoides rotata]